jgi:hypothetical protein
VIFPLFVFCVFFCLRTIGDTTVEVSGSAAIIRGLLTDEIDVEHLHMNIDLNSETPSDAFETETSLKSLTVDLSGTNPPVIYWNALQNLVDLTISFNTSSSHNIDTLMVLSVHLRRLHIRTDVDGTSLSSFGFLEWLKLVGGSRTLGPLPATLKYFEIGNVPNGPNFFIEIATGSPSNELKEMKISSEGCNTLLALPASIEILTVSSMPMLSFWNSTTGLPPSLRELYISDLPVLSQLPELDGLQNLTKLEIVGGDNSHSWFSFGSMPDLTNLPLTSLLIQSPIDNVELDNVLCNQVPVHLLEELDLSHNSHFDELPACMLNFDRLKILKLSFTNISSQFSWSRIPGLLEELHWNDAEMNSPPDWDAWLSSHHSILREVNLASNKLSGTFPNEFCFKPALLKLDLHGNRLESNIHEGCFQFAEHVDLSGNLITGNIPSTGLTNLVELHLQDNKFTQWYNLGSIGATQLVLLDISANDLVTIPSDEEFNTMTSLKHLNLGGNAGLEGWQIPLFWTNHSSIVDVGLHACGFVGSIYPTISSANLRNLVMHHNHLCGPLPEFANPTNMEILILHDNLFNGPIPDSWSDFLNVSVILDISKNFLNGTLPNPFLNAASRKSITSLLLQSNDFTGGVPDLSEFQGILNFGLQDTFIDTCSANPNITHTLNGCLLGAHSDACSCLSYWSQCLDMSCGPVPLTSPDYIAPAHTPHVAGDCSYLVTPPPIVITGPPSLSPIIQPSSSSSCPAVLPLGFICVGGSVFAPTNIDALTVSLPPNSGIIQINGSLNIGSTLTFVGLGSTINASGCVDVPEVVIELQAGEKTKSGPVTLITQSNGCSKSLANTLVKVKDAKSSCKKTKAKNNQSTQSQLIVVFEIDSTSCNTKWIILGSVLGAVLIITVVLALVFSLNDRARECIRPYSKRVATIMNR